MSPLAKLLEAALFAASRPLTVEDLASLEATGEGTVRAALAELQAAYDEAHGVELAEIAGGWQFLTRREYAETIERAQFALRPRRLSPAALETLAIIAYRQPASRPDIDAIRGVNSDAVLESLLDRRMIRIGGRKEAPGRPFLYETTREFLVAFGLRDLSDLPKVDGELGVPEAPAEGSAGVLGGLEAPLGAAQEGTAATDTAQQDPGAGGPGLTPGS